MSDVMRQKYKALSEEGQEQIRVVKEKGQELWNFLDILGSSRELSLAKTKLEEVIMWASKHITH